MANLGPQFPVPLPRFTYPGFNPIRFPAFPPVARFTYPGFNPIRVPTFAPVAHFIWLTAPQFSTPIAYCGYTAYIRSLPFGPFAILAPSFCAGPGGTSYTFLA